MVALVVIGASIAIVVASTAFFCGFCDCMAFVYETEGDAHKAAQLRQARTRMLIRGGVVASLMTAALLAIAWSAP